MSFQIGLNLPGSAFDSWLHPENPLATALPFLGKALGGALDERFGQGDYWKASRNKAEGSYGGAGKTTKADTLWSVDESGIHPYSADTSTSTSSDDDQPETTGVGTGRFDPSTPEGRDRLSQATDLGVSPQEIAATKAAPGGGTEVPAADAKDNPFAAFDREDERLRGLIVKGNFPGPMAKTVKAGNDRVWGLIAKNFAARQKAQMDAAKLAEANRHNLATEATGAAHVDPTKQGAITLARKKAGLQVDASPEAVAAAAAKAGAVAAAQEPYKVAASGRVDDRAAATRGARSLAKSTKATSDAKAWETILGSRPKDADGNPIDDEGMSRVGPALYRKKTAETQAALKKSATDDNQYFRDIMALSSKAHRGAVEADFEANEAGKAGDKEGQKAALARRDALNERFQSYFQEGTRILQNRHKPAGAEVPATDDRPWYDKATDGMPPAGAMNSKDAGIGIASKKTVEPLAPAAAPAAPETAPELAGADRVDAVAYVKGLPAQVQSDPQTLKSVKAAYTTAIPDFGGSQDAAWGWFLGAVDGKSPVYREAMKRRLQAKMGVK